MNHQFPSVEKTNMCGEKTNGFQTHLDMIVWLVIYIS